MGNQLTEISKQLVEIVNDYEHLKSKSAYDDLSDLGYQIAYSFIARSRAAVERATGKESAYSSQIDEILSRPRDHDYDKLKMIIGVVESLYLDIQKGYLDQLSELLHGEIFADFLEMAEYLVNEGYKDAAAVMAGGTLESHLKQLCIKNGIDIIESTTNGTRPKKSDQINADLARSTVYSKLDQKNITAWLDLRNKAAHALYSDYTKEQVVLLIMALRDFITRHPA